METHNVKSFSFDAYAGKHAKNQFTLWHFSKEWRVGIIILSILKVVTWIISIYAGFYFLFKIIFPVVESEAAAKMISFSLLVLTELLTWFFLSKFFKFLIKGIVGVAVFSGVIAIGIYALSFYMTTNGLAMRQADKIDQTVMIVDNSGLEIEQTKLAYSARIDDYRKEIDLIKASPQGWINGQLKRLTAKQLADIKSYNFTIDSLGRAMKTEVATIEGSKTQQLTTNTIQTTAEADKYHNYVIIVMIAQFIFNGLLMFSWSRIFNENDNLQSVREDLAQVKNTIIYSFFQNIGETLLDDANTFIQAQNYQKKEIPFEITNTQPATIIGFTNQAETKPAEQNIGFKQSQTPTNQQPTNNQPTPTKPTINSSLLGKLRSNDMLRYSIKKKDDGLSDWTEKKILSQCGVKKWKLYEFKNLMISANLINEPDKYKKP